MPAVPAATSRRSASPAGDLSKHVGQPVDVLHPALLGHRDEQRVLEPRVVATECVPGMDTALARRAHDVVGVPSDAYCKLLERWPIWKHKLEPPFLEALLRVLGECH